MSEDAEIPLRTRTTNLEEGIQINDEEAGIKPFPGVYSKCRIKKRTKEEALEYLSSIKRFKRGSSGYDSESDSLESRDRKDYEKPVAVKEEDEEEEAQREEYKLYLKVSKILDSNKDPEVVDKLITELDSKLKKIRAKRENRDKERVEYVQISNGKAEIVRETRSTRHKRKKKRDAVTTESIVGVNTELLCEEDSMAAAANETLVDPEPEAEQEPRKLREAKNSPICKNKPNIEEDIRSAIASPASSLMDISISSRLSVTPQRVEIEEETQILEMKTPLLQVGQTYRVFISYIEDGPNKFYVQIEAMKDTLMTLMSDIQKHEPTPLIEPLVPGSVCLARLKRNKFICRGVVLDVMDTQVKIYYVDFGHTDVVPYSEIYRIVPKFMKPKVLSIQFRLIGLKEMNVTKKAKKYFKKLILGKYVELHVCKPEGLSFFQYGNVHFEGRNVMDYLIDRFPYIEKVEYKCLPSLTDNTEKAVQVSHVASCSRFFVQLEKNMKDIEKMITLIFQNATDAPPMIEFAVGLICIARYDQDNKWYRAKILEILGDNVKVSYVDYGNEETVSKNQLRVIRRDFVEQLPCQAFLCVLNGFQSKASNTKLDANFVRLVFGKRLSMRVKNAQPTGLIVDLFDTMTKPPKSIYEQLIKMPMDTGSNSHENSNITRRFNESCISLGKTHQNGEMDVSKTSSGPVSNPFRTANNDDRSYSKSRKDDHNEQRHDSGHQRRVYKDQFSRHDRNNPFDGDGGNNYFNRYAGSNRFSREENDRTNSRNGGKINNRDYSRGEDRFDSYKRKRDFHPDKFVESDSESTASSRGSEKRVKRDNFQGRRDSNNGPYFNKFEVSDNDGFRPRKNDDNSWSNFRTRSTRNDGLGKPREMIIFDPQIDFSEPKEWTLTLPTVSIGGTNCCELVYLTNPSNFFIHQIPQNAKLDELMKRIASAYEIGATILQSSQVKPDLACIAQFADDEKWYRAIIKRVESSSVDVLFVDYGNVEKVSFQQLKEIKEEFTHLPVQAVPCKLFGVKKTDWTAEEIDSFGEVTDGKYLQAEFITKNKDVYQVLLRDINDGVVKSDIINQPFCPGIDLLKEKEAFNMTDSPEMAETISSVKTKR